MKRWVEFKLHDVDESGDGIPSRGYEGGPLPIDHAAAMVFSSSQWPIDTIILKYGENSPWKDKNRKAVVLKVLRTSDEFWEGLAQGD